MTSLVDAPRDTTATRLDPARVSVRVVLSGLWAATLFVFAYVDLFSLYRADFRADLEAGTVSVFSVGQGFLLAVTAYVAIPSAMVALSLVLPARAARLANLVLAPLYAVTIVASTVGEGNAYYLVGSALEVVALVAVTAYAWRWPRTSVPTLRP